MLCFHRDDHLTIIFFLPFYTGWKSFIRNERRNWSNHGDTERNLRKKTTAAYTPRTGKTTEFESWRLNILLYSIINIAFNSIPSYSIPSHPILFYWDCRYCLIPILIRDVVYHVPPAQRGVHKWDPTLEILHLITQILMKYQDFSFY